MKKTVKIATRSMDYPSYQSFARHRIKVQRREWLTTQGWDHHRWPVFNHRISTKCWASPHNHTTHSSLFNNQRSSSFVTQMRIERFTISCQREAWASIRRSADMSGFRRQVRKVYLKRVWSILTPTTTASLTTTIEPFRRQIVIRLQSTCRELFLTSHFSKQTKITRDNRRLKNN